MAKRQSQILDDDSDDEGLELDLSVRPTRKFKGTDDQLVDAETGETEFDDITPALRKVKPPVVADTDEDEDLEEPEVDEEEEEPRSRVVVSDDEDESARGKGRGWKSRLDRERRLKEEAREETNELRARLDKIERGQELSKLETQHTAEVTKAQSEIERLNAQLKQAMEDGETDKQIKLNDQIQDLRVDLRAKQMVFEGQKQKLEQAVNAAPAAAGDVIVKRKVGAWKRQHARFNTDPEFQGFVKGVDSKLCAEGFDPETDEFYEELDKRVKRRYPEEYRNRQARERRAAPSQTVDRDSAPANRSKQTQTFQRNGNKVTLSARQVRNMRQFGMDPENADDVRSYVRENS